MAFTWEHFLAQHRDHIVEEWGKRLKFDVSLNYSQRPLVELVGTTREAALGFGRMLSHGDYTAIDRFIDKITRIRLEAGFPLSDVQKAFELYREILIPILVAQSPRSLLKENIEILNICLAYTIHRFSNHFQEKHEMLLNAYTNQLEADVESRTRELKESEEKYRSLVEDIRDGYLVLRKDRIIYVNPAFCKMHGVEFDRAVSSSFLDFVGREDRDRVARILLEEAGEDPFEYHRLTGDKEALSTEISLRTSRFRGKEYVFAIVRDITRRRALERKNRDLERMAYIGQLTTSLSHEIRNPLSSVKMNLQILKDNVALPGNDGKRLDIALREIQRLEGILRGLLDYAKPMSPDMGPTDVNGVINQCAALLESKLAQRQIQCRLSLDEGLPPVPADHDRLEQLVINLILNAVDSIGQDGDIHVKTVHRRQGKNWQAVLLFQDTGDGIPVNSLSRIFTPFYTTKSKGTGLGLANVKRIVEMHQGTLSVRNSHNGCGTEFEVCLPAGGDHGQVVDCG